MQISSKEIEYFEELHYQMQLNGYFTELSNLPGIKTAFTSKFTDVWYNQAYCVDNNHSSVEIIKAIETYFHDRNRHACIYISPNTNANFQAELKKQNYIVFEEESWMFASIDEIKLLQNDNQLVVRQVEDDYTDFATVYRESLPGPEVEDYINAAIHTHKNQTNTVRITYLLAYKKNKPVGMLGLHIVGKTAGIYAVATKPEARGQGIATTLNARAALIANTEKCEQLMLQTVTGEISEQIFEKLGYRTRFARIGYVPKNIARSLTHG